MTRPGGGHLIATWPDGMELYRFPDDEDDGYMSMVFMVKGEKGFVVDVPYPETRRSPFHSGIWFHLGLNGKDANDHLERKFLWFASKTALLSPAAIAGGAPVRVAFSAFENISIVVPGRLPTLTADWLRPIEGLPTTRPNAEDLVSRTILAWTGRDVVSVVAEPGGDLANCFLVPFGRKALADVRPWAGMTGSLCFSSVSSGDRLEVWARLVIGGRDADGRGTTLADAILDCFRKEGFLLPYELEQWFSHQELQGTLVGGEGLEIARILGTPCPLLLPWPEFLEWIDDA